MKILLISGHGAGDVGACGNGYQEYTLTRELVDLIAPKLRSYATVDVYDQNRNAFYDCQNGSFNIGKYDYVLEVHFNAFNGQAYGTEIYVTDREEAATVEQEIMKNMGNFFTKRGGTGVKVTNFLVINTVKSKGISSALIETCFIDNQNDMNVYLSNKDKVAQTIVSGIVDGFGLGEIHNEPIPAPQPQPVPVVTGTIKSGSVVRPKSNVSYDGVQLASFVCSNDYPVIELNGKRAVLGNGLNTAFNTDNLMLVSGGGSTATAPTPTATIKVGSNVIVTNPVDVNGTPLGVLGTYTVMELNGTRAVIGRSGVVTAAIHIDNLKLA